MAMSWKEHGKSLQPAPMIDADQELAATKEHATETAPEEANREKSTQAQDKEPRSSESLRQVDPERDDVIPIHKRRQQATSTSKRERRVRHPSSMSATAKKEDGRDCAVIQRAGLRRG